MQNSIEVYSKPYPHMVIKTALPIKLYNQLSDEFPEKEVLKKSLGKENYRLSLNVCESTGKLSPLWEKFVDFHTNQPFWLEVLEIFGPSIKLLYPKLNNLEGWSTVKRRMGSGDLLMECQPAVNTPTTKRTKVRGPHVDNPVELYAGLFYMGEGEGNLEVYKYIKTPKWFGTSEIEEDCVEKVNEIKYEPNTYVCFINSIDSIHGITPRGPSNNCRRLVNFALELNNPLFKINHRGL